MYILWMKAFATLGVVLRSLAVGYSDSYAWELRNRSPNHASQLMDEGICQVGRPVATVGGGILGIICMGASQQVSQSGGFPTWHLLQPLGVGYSRSYVWALLKSTLRH